MKVYYVVICHDCDDGGPELRIPFDTAREVWLCAHREGAKHTRMSVVDEHRIERK